MIKLYVLVTLFSDTSASDVCKTLLNKQKEEVVSAEPITGPYDVMVVLEGEDVQKLGKFVVEEIRTLPNIWQTTTSVVLPNI